MPGLHTQHPAADKLTAFGLGRLSEADSTEIEQHLADCEDCRKTLEDIPADSLVCLLQASVSETQAGLDLSSPSADTDSSSLSKESVPPLYKKLAQIIAGKPDERSGPTPSPREGPGGTAVGKAGFTVPRELEGHPRYLVLEPLGAGGMGTVYKAQHRLMERVVALKIINQLLVTKPGTVERFTREVKAAAQLVHPNIVTAYDAEKVGEMHLLVMEFVEGRTLAQVLIEERELSVAKACDYIRQTALGLQHALEQGMVHRDIKPQNLMLTSKGEIKVLDFGLARFVSEQGSPDGSTEHGSLMGSPDYMAPEQAQDAHSADARADIYGMGCTLYHLLAGQVPFPEASLLKKLEAHRDRQAIPLNHLRSDVPADLAKVVARMMAKEPAQRYQTPAEVAEALRPFTHVKATAPSASAASMWRPASSRRTPIFALAIAAALLFLGLGYWLTQIVFRVETPGGTLIITSDDPDVQISVKSGGKEVILFFPKEKKEIPLKVGEYTIELVGGKDGLKLSTKNFRIESGKGKTVTVEFVPAVAEKKTPVPTETKPIADPTPLAEWRKGREFLTVAQKGPADHRTIQEALNAVKAGQYVKVLDKGPYRETILHNRGIADIALVSDVGTRIEVPKWHTWGPSPTDKKKNTYVGCWLTSPNGLRLSGFEFRLPPLPPDTDYVTAVMIWGAGDQIIESCQMRYHGDVVSGLPAEEKERFGRFAGLRFGGFGDWKINKTRFLMQDNLIDGTVELNADWPVQATVQRNWIRAGHAWSLALPTCAETSCTVRHNVIQGRWGIYMGARGPEKTASTAGRYLIANNLIDVEFEPFEASRPDKANENKQALNRAVTIQNNIIRSQSRYGLQMHADDLKAVTGVWNFGHNCFGAEMVLNPSDGAAVVAKQPSDLIVAGPFLSDDPQHADHLRIAADGKLATGGVGGSLPSYIGPLPPGPAPKDGDWFTRLRAVK